MALVCFPSDPVVLATALALPTVWLPVSVQCSVDAAKTVSVSANVRLRLSTSRVRDANLSPLAGRIDDEQGGCLSRLDRVGDRQGLQRCGAVDKGMDKGFLFPSSNFPRLYRYSTDPPGSKSS